VTMIIPPLSSNSDTNNLNVVLQNACSEIDITYKTVPYDGKWYRTSTKAGTDDAGTIKVFPDGQGGIIKNWKTGEQKEFFINSRETLSPEQKEARRKGIDAAIQLRRNLETAQAKYAAESATKLLSQAQPCVHHPYLTSHGITPHSSIKCLGAQSVGQTLRGKNGFLSGDLLLIPITRDQQVVSLEFIDSSGNKSILPQSSKKGGYWLSKPADANVPLVITEAWAKAWSITAATGLPAVGCFGNMRDATLTLKKQYPNTQFIIAGDLGNGEEAARKLAEEIAAQCVIPQFSDGRTKGDWNDLLLNAGKESLEKQILAAATKQPPIILPTPTPPADWKKELTVKTSRDGRKSIIPSLYNSAVIIKNRFKNLLGFNSFRNRIEKRLIPDDWGNSDEQFADEDLLKIAATVQCEYANIPIQTIGDGVRHVAFQSKFNPAQERLKELAARWDGENRLSDWLQKYMSAEATTENQKYLDELGTRWMIGVAARVLKPGCKRDDVLVLQGQQGYLKSTAAQVIADTVQADAFSDSLGDLGNKDAVLGLRGLVVAELAELSAFGKADLESIKAFVTKRVDRVREPYARLESNYERTVSFIGTTNVENFLFDPTGNRRWWPVKVMQQIDIQKLKEVMPQLLGEAAQRFLAGEQWHVSDGVALQQAETVRDNHFDSDVWTESVAGVIKTILRPSQSWVSIGEVMRRMELPISQQNKATKNRVAGILRQMNYTQEQRLIDGSRHRVWAPPPPPPAPAPAPMHASLDSARNSSLDVSSPKPAPHIALHASYASNASIINTCGETPEKLIDEYTGITANSSLGCCEKMRGLRNSQGTSLQTTTYDARNPTQDACRAKDACRDACRDVKPKTEEKPSTPKGINRGHSFPAAPLPFVAQPRKTCGQCGYYDEPIEHHGWCHLMCGEIEGHHVECVRWVAVTSKLAAVT